MNDIGLAVAAVGVRSCQPPYSTEGVNCDRSRRLISPCFYPGFTPLFESVALTIRPTRVLPKQRAVGSIPIARSNS